MDEEFNNFDQIADKMHDAFAEVVKKTAIGMEAKIKKAIKRKKLVDTGFMLNSVYAVTADSSDFSGGDKSFPEVEHPEDDLEAYVAVGANYAAYLEYGTRFIPAIPFFNPAVKSSRANFEDTLNKLEGFINGDPVEVDESGGE